MLRADLPGHPPLVAKVVDPNLDIALASARRQLIRQLEDERAKQRTREQPTPSEQDHLSSHVDVDHVSSPPTEGAGSIVSGAIEANSSYILADVAPTAVAPRSTFNGPGDPGLGRDA